MTMTFSPEISLQMHQANGGIINLTGVEQMTSGKLWPLVIDF